MTTGSNSRGRWGTTQPHRTPDLLLQTKCQLRSITLKRQGATLQDVYTHSIIQAGIFTQILMRMCLHIRLEKGLPLWCSVSNEKNMWVQKQRAWKQIWCCLSSLPVTNWRLNSSSEIFRAGCASPLVLPRDIPRVHWAIRHDNGQDNLDT